MARTDEEIREQIINALEQNPRVNAHTIDVKGENAVVILTGEVADWHAMHTVHDAARFTPGVIDIFNYVSITVPELS